MKVKFNELRKSFSVRMLVILLTVTLVPLMIFGWYSIKYIQSTLGESAAISSEAISEHFIEVYQTNILAQAQQIDLELKQIEQAVLLVKKQTEELFTNQRMFQVVEPVQLVQEEEGYYWDQITDKDKSNTGVTGHSIVNAKMLENLSRSKYLEPLFQATIAQNQHISAIYFIMPDSSWRIYPAMNLVEEIKENFFDPTIPVTYHPFFQTALSDTANWNGIVWTDPYSDVTHRDIMFSATAAIYEHSTLLGVIGADITVENVIHNILDIKFNNPDAYSFLVNAEGELIALQEHGKEHFESLRLDEYFEEGKQLPSISSLQDDHIILSSMIPSTKWYLGYVINKDSLVAPIHETTNEIIRNSENQISTYIMAISFLLIFLCISLSILLWLNFITPIRDVIKGISNLGKGDSSVKIPNSEITEFQKLITAFNTMSGQIDYLLKQLESRHEELTILNQQLEQKVHERTEELKTANVELLERNKQLNQIQHSRAELISNLSHDLKTPLTVLSGYIEAFKDELIPNDQVPLYLDKMNQKISSLNRLVKDMYELSVLEGNHSLIKKEVHSVSEVIETLRIKWGHKKKPVDRYTVDYSYNNRSNLDTVSKSLEIDLIYINRAIENIMENAFKYGDEQYPIDFELIMDDKWFCIKITNMGQGISPIHLPHVFKRTYRVDKSRNSKKSGHGLGLAIVREIVEAHNGNVTVTSIEGKSTTFTIVLPIIHHLT